MRADLPRGYATAQVVHAAGESPLGPVDPGTHAVVLVVPDEAALLAIGRQLAARGINHKIIVEAGGAWDGQATTIGLAPVIDRGPVKRVLGRLPLLE